MRRPLLAAALAAALTSSLAAQSAPQAGAAVAARREAMTKLEPWVGQWQGTGWTVTGPGGQRNEFTITERVQPKAGGLVLLVEGVGKGKDPASGAEVVAHDALA